MISNSNLRFMKNYYKDKVYDRESELIGDEFDINKRQTNKKIFNKVNEEKGTDYKYSLKKHLNVMYGNLTKERVEKLIELVDNANAFAEC